ncbi:MAG: molybdopterin-dependent oxidoreductase [Pirellulales bacterium]
MLPRLLADHCQATRRYFLRAGVATSLGTWLASGLTAAALAADDTAANSQAAADVLARDPALARLLEQLKYFTPPADFGTVERGTPLPYTHPPEKLREIGLTRETWKLEVLPDPASNAKLDKPLTIADGTALDFDTLLQLGQQHAVRYLKIMTCNNGGAPLGMGLWEGVPLREVIWRAQPRENVRRVFYYGYHNDDPKQQFRSSLPIGRVLEDPPGEHPVLLCYKLNGEWLSGKRGGPVRMLVPEAYGFKSVKWLQKVVLTNAPFANDTYADGNNDVDSWMKTFARFVSFPAQTRGTDPIPLTGMAQVGISGLTKVQVWLHPAGEPWPADDPYFTRAPWREATVLPAPTRWSTLPDERLPLPVRGFDPQTGQPLEWPQRYTLAHWATVLRDTPAGKYELRCRTLDARGVAQPLPRPFAKSGRNSIQQVTIEVS